MLCRDVYHSSSAGFPTWTLDTFTIRVRHPRQLPRWQPSVQCPVEAGCAREQAAEHVQRYWCSEGEGKEGKEGKESVWVCGCVGVCGLVGVGVWDRIINYTKTSEYSRHDLYSNLVDYTELTRIVASNAILLFYYV